MKKPTKKKLLKHYATKEPRLFIQYDVFTGLSGNDSFVHPDQDRQAIMYGETYELMSGNTDVRVLLEPEVSKVDAVLALLKVVMLIQREGLPKVEYCPLCGVALYKGHLSDCLMVDRVGDDISF